MPDGERQERRVRFYVHCDASQALALLDIKPKRMGDLLTLSAAKFTDQKRVGLLWIRPRGGCASDYRWWRDKKWS